MNAYKKKAIEIAIAAASGEIIITTDADCVAGKNWLKSIAAFYQLTDSVFIAAPVKIELQKGVLSAFQSLDFLILQGITASSVHKRFHSMCNGANMAYTKKSFFEVNGFKNIDGIASGDDMLLMHKIAVVYPQHYYFIKTKQAIVTTLPVTSWKAFFSSVFVGQARPINILTGE